MLSLNYRVLKASSAIASSHAVAYATRLAITARQEAHGNLSGPAIKTRIFLRNMAKNTNRLDELRRSLHQRF